MIQRVVLVLAAGVAVGFGPPVGAEAKRLRQVPAIQKKDVGKWVGTRALAAASGEVRMLTQKEATDLASSLKGMLDRSASGLRSQTRADGLRQTSLNGAFGSVVLTRPTADGGVETRCVTTFEEATSFLGLAPAAEEQ